MRSCGINAKEEMNLDNITAQIEELSGKLLVQRILLLFLFKHCPDREAVLRAFHKELEGYDGKLGPYPMASDEHIAAVQDTHQRFMQIAEEMGVHL